MVKVQTEKTRLQTNKQTDMTSVNVYWNAIVSLEQSSDVSQLVGLVIYI